MNIIAFTGAGISKSAGIPTFEEVPHLKEKLSLEFKEKYPNEFNKIIENLKNTFKDKQPTKAHFALADLQIPIITMNIDGLHKKAGSKKVYEIHGNYIDDNIVLYGQEILHKNEVMGLVLKTALDAKKYNEKAIFLIIGTSMQTGFTFSLTALASKLGMEIKYINQNADVEVVDFLDKEVFLAK